MRNMHKFILIQLCFLVFWSAGCQSKKIQTGDMRSTSSEADLKSFFVNGRGDTIQKVFKSDAEWKKLLTPLEFRVLREKGTERAFTGDLNDNKQEGIYTCRGCGMPLFSSTHKYDSGSGWPSFFDVLDNPGIHKDTDYNIGYPRTELTCARCGGHLGHVFDDGPKPTGLRYCINAVSLDFSKAENQK
jgi:peptide-methionine (R)-S-oxide reductase